MSIIINASNYISEGGDLSYALNQAVSNFPNGFKMIIPFKEVEAKTQWPALSNVTLEGAGKNVTRVTKTFNGTLCPQFGDYCCLRDLYIFGGNKTGELIIVPTGTRSQIIDNVRMSSTPEKMVVFENLGGLFCRIINSDIGNTSTTIAAIASRGGYAESSAVSRHFTNNETAGGILYDISGMNDTYVSGGYTQGFITSSGTSKATINNMRWGATSSGSYNIYGENLCISNIVASISLGASYGFNLYCVDSDIQIICGDWNVIDHGTGNSVYIPCKSFTPQWTSTGTTQPSIGNGSVLGRWQRAGRLVTASVEIRFGSSTIVGNGYWRFSLPESKQSIVLINFECGGGLIRYSGGRDYQLTIQIVANSAVASLTSIDSGGSMIMFGGSTQTWAPTTTIRYQVSYFVN